MPYATSVPGLTGRTARIRPHFFFNSLNAVLGIMRDDPRRAERALEELGELFRALMRDNRALTPLAEEIALARAYLDIESCASESVCRSTGISPPVRPTP